MNRFVLKITFLEIYLYHFLINTFKKQKVKVRLWKPYLSKTPLSKTICLYRYRESILPHQIRDNI